MEMKRLSLKHWAGVFLFGSLCFSSVSLAQSENISVGFDKLRFVVAGEDHTTQDGMYNNNGQKVPESIVYEGTTYVPVRKVVEMLNMPVQWDGTTKTVWIGAVTVDMRDAEGSVIGHAALSQGENGVNIEVKASGLAPGKHGFHLHQNPIAGNDFATAGGHFNPLSKKHGLHSPDGHHLGDLQNLEVAANGTVNAHYLLEGVTLEKGKDNSVWGKSLIIHAKEDDGVTDPSGNSGDRIAGASIGEVAK
ncbi:superoxide dismutase family protein [Paenibacillus silviterrae]|uniref:superoxide dismutase family protein n=1 Tax=Paenibacillus silviterrae TaxID=3242194 RepID=UPI002543A540|nr:superoxide dismutase family protein [Paenibacillus chinjuensis]